METFSFLNDPEIYFSVLMVSLFYFLYVTVLRRRRNYPPGPWGFPIVGNLPQLGPSPHTKLTQLSQEYGDVFSLQFGSLDAVVLNSSTVVHEALLKRADQFSQRPPFFMFSLERVREFSIAFGEYNPVQINRKKCALRAIHQAVFANVERLNHVVADEFQELKSNFAKNIDHAFDPSPHLKGCVTKIMFNLTFGNGPSNEKLSAELYKLIVGSAEFTESSAACALVDFLSWLKPFLRKPINLVRQSVRDLIQFVRETYSARKTVYGTGSCVADQYVRLLNQSRQTLTDLKEQNTALPSSWHPSLVSDEQIVRSISADIFGAGLETVSSALCWALAYLVNNTAVQRDLQKELDNVVGRQRVPTILDRHNMPLLQATVLEVLRNATVLPLALPHLTSEKTSLGRYEVPKGTLVIVNLWAVNHDPRVFEEPNSFKPRRFLKENGTLCEDTCKRHMSFSTGGRRCLGGTLAKAVLFLILACLLQNFEFSNNKKSAVNTEGVFGMTLKPKPFTIRVRPR